MLHHARRRSERRVVKTVGIVKTVKLDGVRADETQETGLLIVPLPFEDAAGLVQGKDLPFNGSVRSYEFFETLAKEGDRPFFRRSRSKFAIITVAEGMTDMEPLTDQSATDHHEEKGKSPPIDFHPFKGRGIHERDPGILIHLPAERPEIAVHPPGHDLALM
jgi:hypothetical protein